MKTLTKEELIDLLIDIDREDMEASENEDGTMTRYFSEELSKRIGSAILPTLERKCKELRTS